MTTNATRNNKKNKIEQTKTEINKLEKTMAKSSYCAQQFFITFPNRHALRGDLECVKQFL